MRRYCQHLLQKLSNNGGVDAATEQMKAKQYAEPFKADKRKVTAFAIEKSPRCHTHRGLFPFYAPGIKCAISILPLLLSSRAIPCLLRPVLSQVLSPLACLP